jgi:hypothetical protein
MASSSSSGDLFTFKKASAVAVFQRAEPAAAPAAEPRAHRRTQGEQAHKRSRAISVDDDEEEDEEVQAAAAPQSSPATRRAAPRGHCAPADDDEAAWVRAHGALCAPPVSDSAAGCSCRRPRRLRAEQWC